ncbi:hypothetical protein K439DRAFT_1356839 [Ramaria rubella]|nr:hypothetical protein K439DRAFT_1356839 [Ramaria rubella]
MPLYELLCITTHLKEYRHIKELVKTCATHVMDSGGVVRSLNNWGTRVLPNRMHRHQQWHTIGDYWTMHFDTSPRVLHALNRRLRKDPRVIRWTMTKLGERIEVIAEPTEQTITRLNPYAQQRDIGVQSNQWYLPARS